MSSDLRRKYNLDDRHPAFPRYDRINNNEKEDKANCCIPVSIFAVTLLNTFYVGISLYLYENTIDGFIERAKISPSDGEEFDEFSGSLSLYG